MLFFGGVQAANTGTNEYSNFVSIHLFQVHPRIEKRLMRRNNAKLCKTVRSPDFLRGWKRWQRIKTLYLSGNLAIIVRDIERRDTVDPALAIKYILPERVDFLAESGNDSETRDDDPAFRNGTAHK